MRTEPFLNCFGQMPWTEIRPAVADKCRATQPLTPAPQCPNRGCPRKNVCSKLSNCSDHYFAHFIVRRGSGDLRQQNGSNPLASSRHHHLRLIVPSQFIHL